MTDAQVPEGGEDSLVVQRAVNNHLRDEVERLRVRVQEEFMRRRDAERRLADIERGEHRPGLAA